MELIPQSSSFKQVEQCVDTFFHDVEKDDSPFMFNLGDNTYCTSECVHNHIVFCFPAPDSSIAPEDEAEISADDSTEENSGEDERDFDKDPTVPFAGSLCIRC